MNTLVQSPLLWGKACSGSYFQIFDMASASGYIGVKHVQEVDPRFLTCPRFMTYIDAKRVQEVDLRVFTCSQLVGTWMQNMFRTLVPDF